MNRKILEDYVTKKVQVFGFNIEKITLDKYRLRKTINNNACGVIVFSELDFSNEISLLANVDRIINESVEAAVKDPAYR